MSSQKTDILSSDATFEEKVRIFLSDMPKFELLYSNDGTTVLRPAAAKRAERASQKRQDWHGTDLSEW